MSKIDDMKGFKKKKPKKQDYGPGLDIAFDLIRNWSKYTPAQRRIKADESIREIKKIEKAIRNRPFYEGRKAALVDCKGIVAKMEYLKSKAHLKNV